MMTKLYLALSEAVAIVSPSHGHTGEWAVDVRMSGRQSQCLAVDPHRPQRMYCGTADQGLWRSDNAGVYWERVGAGIAQPFVLAVAVSPTERTGEYGVVYAGTEPSALYRSEDGGDMWQDLSAWRQLPSAPTWVLPDQPAISRIRHIALDPLASGRLFVAIEADALLRSLDGGRTWEDRTPSGPYDTHTVVMSRLAPNRLYAAAGDGFILPGRGFFQSDDGGQTWHCPDEGLQQYYLWSMAADPDDPATLVVSAAPGPDQAHTLDSAESMLYRRTGNGPWQHVREGFPEPHGLLITVLATNEAEPGVFYAASNKGVFRSASAGASWEALRIRWPQGLSANRVNALRVAPE